MAAHPYHPGALFPQPSFHLSILILWVLAGAGAGVAFWQAGPAHRTPQERLAAQCVRQRRASNPDFSARDWKGGALQAAGRPLTLSS